MLSEKELQQKNRSFNELTAKEWTSYSASVIKGLSSPRNSHCLNHGATFPQKLSDRLITCYSKPNDTVLDIFLGTGTTLASCVELNRQGIGIELTDRFYDVANEYLSETYPNGNYSIIKGDCEDQLLQLQKESVQLVVTSPPYADLIHKVVKDRQTTHKNSVYSTENGATTNVYSENPNDLGNMPLQEYREKIQKIMNNLYPVLKKGGYNVWIVQDFRDTKNKMPYIDLHTIVADCGKKAGFTYHDLIVWDRNDYRKLVCIGYPSVFYSNINHAFIVVMRK